MASNLLYESLLDDSPSTPLVDINGQGIAYLDYDGTMANGIAYFKWKNMNGSLPLVINSSEAYAIIIEDHGASPTLLQASYALSDQNIPIYFINRLGITCQDCAFTSSMIVHFSAYPILIGQDGTISLSKAIPQTDASIKFVGSCNDFHSLRLHLYAPNIQLPSLLKQTSLLLNTESLQGDRIIARNTIQIDATKGTVSSLQTNGNLVLNTNHFNITSGQTGGLYIGGNTNITVGTSFAGYDYGQYNFTGDVWISGTQASIYMLSTNAAQNLLIEARHLEYDLARSATVQKNFSITTHHYLRTGNSTFTIHGNYEVAGNPAFYEVGNLEVYGNSNIVAKTYKAYGIEHYHNDANFWSTTMPLNANRIVDGKLHITDLNLNQPKLIYQEEHHYLHLGSLNKGLIFEGCYYEPTKKLAQYVSYPALIIKEHCASKPHILGNLVVNGPCHIEVNGAVTVMDRSTNKDDRSNRIHC